MRTIFGSPAARTKSLLLVANAYLGRYREVVWLIGDGRSGTTWVSSLINHQHHYRGMFEPFHPRVLNGTEAFQPNTYIRPDDPREAFRKVAAEVFSGRLTHSRVDRDTKPTLYSGLSQAIGRFLFPSLVEGATRDSPERLQLLLIQGTRLSLAMVVPMALILALLADYVVAAWVGPRFEGSVSVVWVLAVVVSIRIGALTAYALLKGSGHHQFAASASVLVALTNLGLSILLVRPFGLVGVALGTLLPVSISSMFVLVPRACRRADLPVGVLVRQAVWPAIWPALPTALVVLLVRTALTGIPAILTGVASGALVYSALFLGLAVGDRERQRYVRLAFEIFRKPVAAAASS